MLCRFFKNLQQGVLSLLIHKLSLADNENAFCAVVGQKPRLFAYCAHIVNFDGACAFIFLKNEDIGVVSAFGLSARAADPAGLDVSGADKGAGNFLCRRKACFVL